MNSEQQRLWRAAIAAGMLSAVIPCSFMAPPVWAAEMSNSGAGMGTGQNIAATEAEENKLPDFTLEAITVEAKRPDWEAKLSPGTVTIIRPDDYKGEQKDLPDFLKMVPGVHVREVSGKGQYTTVSVRGSTAAQVGLFVDGVLFNLGGDAAADISTIPIHNVERIEVYRGYIPARFGGTFMGGVINIVTKRPSKADVQASYGQSSYGGYKGSLQVTAPLGSGTLMVGVNHDQSDGDFKYKNFSNDEWRDYLLKEYNKSLSSIPEQINRNLGWLREDIGINLGSDVSDLEDAKRRCAPEGELYKAFWALNPADYGCSKEDWEWVWKSNFGQYVDPAYSEELKKRYPYESYASSDRWRMANDYKNTDAILKWQDDHWLAKATWKRIKRHMPFPYNLNYGNLWGIDSTKPEYFGNMFDLQPSYFNDPLNIYVHRNQKLTTKEALLGRRDTVGNLEWGWSVNYLKQDKDYYVDNWQWVEKNHTAINTFYPNSLWSDFCSRRLGAKFDGTYKAGDRHLIEFLIDGSKEKMDINGWRMFDYDKSSQDTRKRWRNYYEQKIFNAQLQDTITLNKQGDFWLTPSLRYNRSTIMGRSERYKKGEDPQGMNWFHTEDEQTDQKVTWQLALKKQFNDRFTMRATAGTYYRLLNMYEIAGDGAGILPMPNVGGDDCVFPRPEEGSQWDVSAIWDGKWLGADTAKFQLSYFGRDSKNMLQLMSRHFFLFYTNANKAKVNGAELQADMSWKKWDLNLQATYTQPRDVIYDRNKMPGYSHLKLAGFLTYQPKWEGMARLAYRPDNRWNLFTQLRYVGGMATDPVPLITGKVNQQSSLTTMDIGAKYRISPSFGVTIGCNDIWNKANSMYFRETTGRIRNIYYPIPGRTFYATLEYQF